MSVVFFTDRDLGRKIPDALAATGYSVERHDSHFRPLTPDPIWIQHVGARGWIALSHNREIRYRSQERDMVMRAGVPLFLLIGKATHEELALNLVQTMPQVIAFLGRHTPPFIARIYRPSPVEDVARGRPGRVEMWLDLHDWKKAVGRSKRQSLRAGCCRYGLVLRLTRRRPRPDPRAARRR